MASTPSSSDAPQDRSLPTPVVSRPIAVDTVPLETKEKPSVAAAAVAAAAVSSVRLSQSVAFDGYSLTPEDLVNVKESATGEYLKAYLMGDE
jgi:hypothetical protein